METSDAAERVLVLERKVFQLRKNLDDMVSWRMPAAEQQLAMSWAGARRGCVTTFNGMVIGGLGNPLAGLPYVPMPDTTLEIYGHQTGTHYGTYSLPTGNFSIGLEVSLTDTSLDFYPFGPATSPRFIGATPRVYTQSLLRCTTNNNLAFRPPAAPGYAYLSAPNSGTFACQYPVGTLNYSDTQMGTGTAVSVGGGPDGMGSAAAWVGPCFLYNTFATIGFCAAKSNVPCSLIMLQGANVGVNYKSTAGGGCPETGTCPGVDRLAVVAQPATLASKTDPAWDLSVGFDATWNVHLIGRDEFHNNVPYTVRFWE